MGNRFCSGPEQQNEENLVVYEQTYNGILIKIINGTMMGEEYDQLIKFNIEGQMQPQQIDKRTKIIDLPIYYETSLNTYYQSYAKMFQNLSGRILLIEDSTSFKNPIPKQYNAEMLIRSLIEYIDNKEATFKLIKIVGLHLVSLKFMRYELDRIIQEQQFPELAGASKQKFLRFVNPSQSFMRSKFEEEQEYLKEPYVSLTQIELNSPNIFLKSTMQDEICFIKGS
ncbi:hypothetical protein pb186bvf_018115 [Paramecium bursaria]